MELELFSSHKKDGEVEPQNNDHCCHPVYLCHYDNQYDCGCTEHFHTGQIETFVSTQRTVFFIDSYDLVTADLTSRYCSAGRLNGPVDCSSLNSYKPNV